MMTRIYGKKNIVLRRDKAAKKIESKADEIRARFATPGKHVIYEKKYQEALKYIAAIVQNAPPPDLKKYPYIKREVGLTAPTPLQVAQLWVSMSESLDQVAPLIEEVSLRGKYAVKSAQSQDEIDEIVLVTVDQLDSIGEPSPSMIGKAQ